MPELTLDLQRKLYTTKLGIDNDDVEIGDGKSLTNLNPQVKFFRWNKENSLGIKFTDLKAPATFNNETKTLEIKDSKIGFYFNRADDIHLKFGLIFYEKPAVNSWNFQLEGWEELNFYYQPPLANTNPDGSTWEENSFGGRSDRPAEVSGSYAIYHKNKRNYIRGQTNYRCGKFGHFYRPKFIDTNGKWVWGNLHIENGIYTISIPQDFLDDAIYPIKVNDTFGELSEGVTFYNGNANWYWGQKGIPSFDGSGYSIHFYGKHASGAFNFKGALVLASNKNIVSNGIGNAVEIDTTLQWWESIFSVAPTIVGSTVYYVGTVNQANGFQVRYDDVGSSGDSIYDSTNSYASPTNPTDATNNTWHVSIYCEYTPAGGAELVIADASHVHTSENVVLTQKHTLVISDCSHSHIADNIVLISVALDQEGYLFRDDDGDEDEASPLASQDANITRAKNKNTRIRFLINATGNPTGKQFQLEYRKKGVGDWMKV